MGLRAGDQSRRHLQIKSHQCIRPNADRCNPRRGHAILILSKCSHAKITNETADWKTESAAKERRNRKRGKPFLRSLRSFAAKLNCQQTLDFGLWGLDFNLRAVSKMLKASGAMAAATLLSRVLGMLRVMAYAWFMGDNWVAGAFTF